ncbi:SRPBCC domain-containing protein [Streptomyces sp. NPDC051940]|uniref:SRPBCC family protein n=1 Tax=Streptomyces sp. NPDC051940 TaxID=3155675 RepID=UPI0034375334
MAVTDVKKDLEARTLTFTARFAAPPARVWQVWEDPRQLERWWGPPTYPATFVDHELKPGGEVLYFMTGPEGDKHYGWWRVTSVDAPRELRFRDGFGDETGKPSSELPETDVTVRLSADGDAATVMTVESVYGSREAMEQVLSMGMEEGMTLAVNQIDALLADSAA